MKPGPIASTSRRARPTVTDEAGVTAAPAVMGPHVRLERRGAVATIVLDRPARRNAVDRRTAADLRAAFEAFEADPASRVAVLFGAGGHFCAGADLAGLADEATRLEVKADGSGPGPMGPTRMAFSKPVIAAVAGYAVAGGLELALMCDLRVVEEGAVFGVFCRRWGVPLIDGGTIRLPRLIGMGRALDLILTGRPVPAAEALALGLASRVVADGQARAEAEALAARIAAFPQACLLADRRSALENSTLALTEALGREGAGAYPVVFAEALAGAARFAGGAGRHGRFESEAGASDGIEEATGITNGITDGITDGSRDDDGRATLAGRKPSAATAAEEDEMEPVAKIEGAALEQAMLERPQWQIESGGLAILRTFQFRGFDEAFAFMTRLALHAEKHDHHPEWSNVYNRVAIRLTTHDAGGVTARDLALARAADEAFGSR